MSFEDILELAGEDIWMAVLHLADVASLMLAFADISGWGCLDGSFGIGG